MLLFIYEVINTYYYFFFFANNGYVCDMGKLDERN